MATAQEIPSESRAPVQRYLYTELQQRNPRPGTYRQHGQTGRDVAPMSTSRVRFLGVQVSPAAVAEQFSRPVGHLPAGGLRQTSASASGGKSAAGSCTVGRGKILADLAWSINVIVQEWINYCLEWPFFRTRLGYREFLLS
jgi:hypothetical protein